METLFCGVPLSSFKNRSDVWTALLNDLGESLQEEVEEYHQMPTAGEFTNDDPTKIGTGAIKYDGNKPAVWRGVINYFPRALWAVAEVSTFGAKKYAWDGWEDVADGFARYKDAQFRHALKKAMGEDCDKDSELHHLAHEAWGALATLELFLRAEDKEV